MSAPVETEAKPVEPVAPVVDGSSYIPAETAAPVEEYKKEEVPKPTEYAPAPAPVVEETTPAAPEPAKEEAKTEDKPAEITETKEDGKADKAKPGLLAKWFGARRDKVVKEVKTKSPKSPKKKEKKKEEDKKEEKKEDKKEEAAVAAEVPKEEAKPAEPAPVVEEPTAPAPEPVKETETAPAEAPKEETEKTEEKPAEKKAKEVKITRRLSTRITGLFKKEARSKEETPAVAEEAPKLDEVAPAAPLEDPKTEAKVDPPTPAVAAAA